VTTRPAQQTQDVILTQEYFKVGETLSGIMTSRETKPNKTLSGRSRDINMTLPVILVHLPTKR